jgi:hypothetical protein
MAKIERKTQKIFAGNAATDELAVFGSMITGTPGYNDDIEALQSEAYTEGWKAAVAANEAPFMEEMNAVQYGFSKQLAYLFQQGIPEWDAGTTYYLNSFCQVGGVIYKSKLDENINHSPGDDTEEMYWTPFKAGDGGSGGLEVCDIGMSLYIDETKGLRRWLNGQIVAINQNTQGFLTRLKKIVALYPSLLTTEENWQAEKEASDYGQVGKFVLNYDDVADKYHAVGYDRYIFEVSLCKTTDTINLYRTAFCIHKLKDNIEIGDIGYLFDTATGEENQNITFTVTQVEANAGTENAFFRLGGTVSGYPDYDPPGSGIESALDGTDIAANNNNSPVLQILKGPTYTKSRPGEGKNFCIPDTTIGAVCYEVPYPSSPNSFTAIPHLLTHFEFVDGGELGGSSYSIGIDNEEILTDYGLYPTQPVYHYTPSTKVLISMRLPAVVNVQGVLNLQNAGLTIKAELPNIIGTFRGGNTISGTALTGAFYNAGSAGDSKSYNASAGREYYELYAGFNASLSSPKYKDGATVQEEAIQYPYYIQIATGQETEVNITNEIELNNPFFFGMSQYFDVEPNNLSWLKSDGMYKPKSVYPDYYNWILENVNKGVEGFKGQEGYCFIATDSSSYYWWVSTESPVVGASVYRYDVGVNSMFFDGTVETLTSNGFTFTSIFEGSSYTVTRDSSKDTSILHPTAWITDNDFEINTSDETFKLPLLDGSECLVSDRYIDLTLQASGTKYTAVANGFVFFEKLNTSNTQFVKGTNLSSGYADISYGTYSGSTPSILLKVKRGDIFSIDYNAKGVTNSFRFIYARGNGSLYYYVGETVQNANLIDAGRMQEQITNINAPSRGYLVESYVNNKSWYRIYSDGWCEQGGQITVTEAATNITLLKSYKDNNYNAVGCQANINTAGYHTINVGQYNATQIQIRQNVVGTPLVNWIAMGYIK